ncbi:hypothetical protein M1N16_01140 [Nitrospinaceae bacterium]|nr:hypothetical protein [Nitrospinaceae bacterium]
MVALWLGEPIALVVGLLVILNVAIDNALGGSLAFLTNHQVVRKMRQTVRVASTDSRFIMDEGNTLPYHFR